MVKKEPVEKKLFLKSDESPAEIIRLAVLGKVDLEKLEKLLVLQERWDANQAKKAFSESMVTVQKNIVLVAKTLTNSQTHSKYASLGNIICQTKEVYTEYGFSISFYEGQTEKLEHIRICADVVHRLGHKETYHFDVPLDGKGIKGNANMTSIHAKASSTSYAWRYLMCMIWNIPTSDDNDGNQVAQEKISEEELKKIKELLVEIGAEEKRFLQYMSVGKLEDILKSDYPKALVAIEGKRKVEVVN